MPDFLEILMSLSMFSLECRTFSGENTVIQIPKGGEVLCAEKFVEPCKVRLAVRKKRAAMKIVFFIEERPLIFILHRNLSMSSDGICLFLSYNLKKVDRQLKKSQQLRHLVFLSF